MAGGNKVKVRKVSLAVNSPARRKASKPNTNTGLNNLPPFQWSSGGQDQKQSTSNNVNKDRTLMPPPIITRGLKNSGMRQLLAQYSQVSDDLVTVFNITLP